MVHGYHIILPHYGFWLPNDPRGSWSLFVARWEIARFGKTTRHLEQRTLAQLSEEEMAQRVAARKAPLYPPIALTGQQALSVANGFKQQAAKSSYSIWACAILPEHTHLVVARHLYKAEQIANLLKGAATRQLIEDDLHPLANYAVPGKRPPGMWQGMNGKSIWTAIERSRTPSPTLSKTRSKKANPDRTGAGSHSTAAWTVDG